MRRLFATLVPVLMIVGFATSASAGSIPTYALTSGTVYLTQGSGGASVVQFNFSGPSGIWLAGFSDIPQVCQYAVAPSSCLPSATTSPSDMGDTVSTNAGGNSGIRLWQVGGITLTAPGLISLPTEPVFFSGTFSVCPTDDGDGCSAPMTAHFNVHGTGTGLFLFDNSGFGVNGIWSLQSATYTLAPTPTPEPASLTLFGTGAFALLGQFLRRKKH
jgi:hypothetical protein